MDSVINNENYSKYFELFGLKEGLKLLKQKEETVKRMIMDNNEQLMYYWFKKTNYSFIPDYIVMQNFPISEIDKFIKNKSSWARLMKITEYSSVYEGVLSLLKLAYIYGVFEGNSDEINHLEYLLKGLPLTISKENIDILLCAEDNIKRSKKYGLILPAKSEVEEYYKLREEVVKNNLISSDSEYIFNSIYKYNGDVFVLRFNYQKYQDLVFSLRNFMDKWGAESILSPFKVYQFVKDFKMQYDPYFKDFFVQNINLIISDYDKSIYLSKIQSEFSEIRKMNNNRKLIYDLAVEYVKECNYTNIDIGNEFCAELVSKIGCYSEENFEVLQEIYNYGKFRIYSSIPRIKGIYNDYSYEILKLDSPYALVIGNITDCCQKINDNAEMCMEHSMVDNNGRILVIYDKNGNIVSQSWVWRNKNVICFDDIEIPNKILIRKEREAKSVLARYNFAEDIYEVYKHISLELIEKDNETYTNLLLNHLITKKQYYGLKLSKVIVGKGHNDIENVICNNASFNNKRVMPLPFTPLVKLNNPLYLKDSEEQYIISECAGGIDFDIPTLAIYNDEYSIYDYTNITNTLLSTLENQRKITLGSNDNMPFRNIDMIIYEYNSNKENMRLIIHPNFSIIYEEYDDCINLLEVFFGSDISKLNDIVIMQLNLALKQILDNKRLEIQSLSIPKELINIDSIRGQKVLVK